MDTRISDARLAERLGYADLGLGSAAYYLFGATQAIMYWRIFFPRFVEYRGMIFHEESVDYNQARVRIDQALDMGETPEQVERSFNFHSMELMFLNSRATEEEADEILRLLVMSWALKLERDYPSKAFVVRKVGMEEGNDPGIEFYQLSIRVQDNH